MSESVPTSQSTQAATAARPHLPSAGRRTPVSTYRLQLGPELTFDQAAEQLNYLEDLGVTDLYLSPILTAAPGSTSCAKASSVCCPAMAVLTVP